MDHAFVKSSVGSCIASDFVLLYSEYEKKHGASNGPTCSIERFMLFVYRRIRPWYRSFVVLLHWPS